MLPETREPGALLTIGLQFPEFCGERFSGILRKNRTFSGIKMFKSRINGSAPQAPTKIDFGGKNIGFCVEKADLGAKNTRF